MDKSEGLTVYVSVFTGGNMMKRSRHLREIKKATVGCDRDTLN